MHADVRKRSAACELRVGEPAAQGWDAGAPQPGGLGEVRSAQPPSSITSLSAWMSPRRRWLKATSRTRPALRAASTMAWPSTALRAIGFSLSTCRPRSSAAMAMGACRNVGTATLIASRPPCSSISSQPAKAFGIEYSACRGPAGPAPSPPATQCGRLPGQRRPSGAAVPPSQCRRHPPLVLFWPFSGGRRAAWRLLVGHGASFGSGCDPGGLDGSFMFGIDSKYGALHCNPLESIPS